MHSSLLHTLLIVKKKTKKTAVSLLGVKQRNEESLRENISRFNLEALEIVDLSITYTMQLLIKGLKEGPLQLFLSKKRHEI